MDVHCSLHHRVGRLGVNDQVGETKPPTASFCRSEIVEHPTSIDTTTRVASMRQIHAAIGHLERQDFECAITLAAAAEGMLPSTGDPFFHQKVKALAASLPKDAEGATGPNDVITWLKHGTYKGKKCESATIDYFECVVTIWRATSKFIATYDDISPQMESCLKAIGAESLAEKKEEAAS
jgi:hypothetical protein